MRMPAQVAIGIRPGAPTHRHPTTLCSYEQYMSHIHEYPAVPASTLAAAGVQAGTESTLVMHFKYKVCML